MKNALIICYSYSGNTYKAAEEIRKQTGGTFCELYPLQPYPLNFNRLLKQVRKEISSGSYPRLFPVKECPEDYSTIFLGTPNWCGTLAPVVSSWLLQKNLTGKIIAPFYTHCGGGIGNIEADIQSLCPNSEIRKGISIINDGGSRLPEQITLWLKGIKSEGEN